MPIRMTDDPNQSEDFDDSSGGRRNVPGGGGGLLSLLPLLLGLFKGKGGIILLVIAAAAYFLLNRSGGCNPSAAIQNFSESGYNFNKDTFDKAAVYEGLEDNNLKNPLPEAVSLLRFAPNRENQGQQGSCVAWSC